MLKQSGGLVSLEETEDGHLKIILTDEGREFLTKNAHFATEGEHTEIQFDAPSSELLGDLLEYVVCNSDFELLNENTDYAPIGALTSAPIIAWNTERTEQGDLQDAEKVWWFPNYMVENELETLLNKGEVTFTRAT